jgi:hypothetical protein
MDRKRGVQMSARISSIIREAPRSYRVSLETNNGNSLRSFIFEVQEGEIDVVTYHDDFVLYMSHNLAPAAPLLEAVLGFHRAQNMELPIAEN